MAVVVVVATPLPTLFLVSQEFSTHAHRQGLKPTHPFLQEPFERGNRGSRSPQQEHNDDNHVGVMCCLNLLWSAHHLLFGEAHLIRSEKDNIVVLSNCCVRMSARNLDQDNGV